MTKSAIFLLVLLTGLFTSFIHHPPEPKGCAIIISVPVVDNDQLHKKKLLADTLIFEALPGTIKDGEAVSAILKKHGFKDENIIRVGAATDDKITVKNIRDAFAAMAKKVADNDLFVFYYSGHGHQVLNFPKNDTEPDGKDEVFVAWDGYFIDDQVRAIYQKSFSKTRNVMIADACNAGSAFGLTKRSAVKKNDVAALGPIWDCTITPETNVDETINMIYYGASKDGAEAWGNAQGGYFTQAMNFLDNMYWKKNTPRELACKISTKMIILGDDGNGEIQYAELGKLPIDFTTTYLFKIK